MAASASIDKNGKLLALSSISIKRPVTITMLFVGIAFLGILAL